MLQAQGEDQYLRCVADLVRGVGNRSKDLRRHTLRQRFVCGRNGDGDPQYVCKPIRLCVERRRWQGPSRPRAPPAERPGRSQLRRVYFLGRPGRRRTTAPPSAWGTAGAAPRVTRGTPRIGAEHTPVMERALGLSWERTPQSAHHLRRMLYARGAKRASVGAR
ncbi:hypothetical protein NDU88_006966 [Pleurodeles waltl]|uniref:Uncharacterized protein n=1 Tax=Pleurodeles waltl TaxID=8319 RepID=A0AAV7NUW4_PLEWA|nr:hypothetical protein NDU88_006966 [Pleurodeles waltl]